MNKYDVSKLSEKDLKHLDAIKQQTLYKIKFISSYVEKWLLVSLGRKDITSINYIDCMCNAGIYKTGDFCSCICIIEKLVYYAKNNSNKKFNIFLNDYDSIRINILKKVISELFVYIPSNVNININIMDVNDYLQYYSLNDLSSYGNSNLLFVDPYNLGTVKVDIMSQFVHKYYCDLFFNYFVSDFTRNGLDNKKMSTIGEVVVDENDIFSSIKNRLMMKNIKYIYLYDFKTSKNIVLYKMLFATPNIKGLIVFKDSIWDVFDGADYYINHDERNISLFGKEQNKEMYIESYKREASELLLSTFSDSKVNFKDIQEFVLLETPFKNSQIINIILRPLIKQGLIKKCNEGVSNKNYKEDYYIFDIYEKDK